MSKKLPDDLKARFDKMRGPIPPQDLEKRYPWIVPGSIRGKGNDRKCTIACQKKGCTKTRRTRTMDAFQVRFCKTHQRERDLALLAKRRKRWRERDRERRRAVREGKA